MLRHAIAAGLVLVQAQLAGAATNSAGGSATIEWNREPEARVILEDVAWHCTGNDCSGSLTSDGPGAVARYCRVLARHGRVTSFRTASGPLEEAELLRCNKGKAG